MCCVCRLSFSDGGETYLKKLFMIYRLARKSSWHIPFSRLVSIDKLFLVSGSPNSPGAWIFRWGLIV